MSRRSLPLDLPVNLSAVTRGWTTGTRSGPINSVTPTCENVFMSLAVVPDRPVWLDIEDAMADAAGFVNLGNAQLIDVMVRSVAISHEGRGIRSNNAAPTDADAAKARLFWYKAAASRRCSAICPR